MRKALIMCLFLVACAHEQATNISMDYSTVAPLVIDTYEHVYRKAIPPEQKSGTIEVLLDSMVFTSDCQELNFSYAILYFKGGYLDGQFVCKDRRGKAVLVNVSEDDNGYAVEVMEDSGGYVFGVDTVR